MKDASSMILAIGVILSIAGVLAAAYAVFRTSVVTKTVELYRSENEALGKALARRETEATAMAERLAALEQANQVLRETVTGEIAIKAVGARLEENHRAQTALLMEIRDKVGGR